MTALKYAGCEIAEEDHPESVEEIRLEGPGGGAARLVRQRDPPPAQPAPGELVRVEDVSFSYDDNKVLSHVDLTVSACERIALVGKNGAGKTTLATC